MKGKLLEEGQGLALARVLKMGENCEKKIHSCYNDSRGKSRATSISASFATRLLK